MTNNQIGIGIDATYYYTISWDGIDEYTEGSVTFTSPDERDAVQNIQHYLDYYKDRDAYLSNFAVEGDGYSKNLLTDELKNKLVR